MYPQRVTQAYFRVRRQALPGRKRRRPAYCRLTPSRSLPREANIMTKLASIHFAKCRPGAAPERHNARQYSNDDFRPSYFLPTEDQQDNTFRDLLEPRDTSTPDAAAAADHARAYFDQVKSHYSGRGKRAKYDNCRREAILNLSENSTEDDVRGVVKYLEDKWHIKTTSYAIHRDEGYKDQDGTVHRNLHCHLVLETLYVDQQTGKPKQAWSEIGRAELHQIQDDIAKLMHMERTQTQGKPRKHLDRNSYVQVRDANDRAEAATKAAALETEKATKAKAEAAKQAQETARQAAQVRHDIEVHKLQPSGILVNRALREANAAQAAQIDKLHQQAKWTAAKHQQDLKDKDRQITEARNETDAKRQTISQLRAQVAELQQTIKTQQDRITEQTETIKKQNLLISAYEYLANMMWDTLSEYRAHAAKTVYNTAEAIWTKAVNAAGELGNTLYNVWEWTTKHKEREEAARLEQEKAARAEREAAERRQAEEAARKSRGRGYSR